MAFNAGSIEATLTLNRNPFTAGLAVARKQARDFAKERYEATARIKVDQTSFNAARKQLADFAKQSRQALAKVNVDRLLFDKLVKDLRAFGKQTYTAKARVDTGNGARELGDLVKAIDNAGRAADKNSKSFTDMGDEGHMAFSRMHGGVRILMMALPALLPVAGTAVTGVIGLVGGLISILAVAGVGVGAFAAVAVPTFTKIKDAVAAGQAEINKLPPGLREAGNALKGLQDDWKKLVEATQTPVGLTMAAGFNAARAALAPLQPLIVATADTLTQIGQRMTEYFNTSHYTGFVNFVTGNINPVLTKLFEIIAFGTRSVMNLAQAFMPLGQWILDSAAKGMQQFAEWTSKLAGDPKFAQWLDLVKESLTRVWEFLVEVTKFLFNLANALAPIGNIILGVLTSVFQALNKMPPEWLAAIAGGLSAIMTALLLGAGGPMTVVAGAIAAIAFALVSLYDSSERVRGAIDPLIATIRDIFQPIFQRLSDLFEQKIIPAFTRIGDTILTQLIPAFNGFLQAAAPFISFFTEQVGIVAIDAIEKLLVVIDYTLKEISSALRLWAAIFTGDWNKAWEEIQLSFGLKMGLIETLFGDMWTDIKTTMSEEGVIVAGEWTGMWEGILTTLREEGEILKIEWAGIWTNIKTTAQEEEAILDAEWAGMWESLKTTLLEEKEILQTEVANMWLDIQTTMQEEEALMDLDWSNMWVSIKETLLQEAELIKVETAAIWPAIRTTAVEEWEILKTDWSNMWISIKETLTQEGELLKTEWDTMWTDLKTTLIEEKDIIVAEWQTFWADLQTSTSEGGSTIQSEWNSIWPSIKETAIQEWNQIVADWTGMWESIKTTLSEELGILEADWNNLWTGVGDVARTIWNGLGGDWDAFISGLVSTAVTKWGEIKQAFSEGAAAVRGAVNGMIGGVNKVLGFFGIGGIPMMASGGTLTYDMVPKYASGGQMFSKVGGGFKTDGPKAIVGEGSSKYPEYVVPTDPKYRSRATGLYQSLGSDLNMMATGGVLGTGLPSLTFPTLPSLGSVMSAMAGQASGPWLSIAQGVAQRIWSAVETLVNNAIQAAMAAVANAIAAAAAAAAPPGGAVPMYDKGGYLPPGRTMALNATGAPEAVLTRPQWDAVMTNRDNSDILRKLDELIEATYRTAGPPVINVNAGTTQGSNGRNDQLALRLGRR